MKSKPLPVVAAVVNYNMSDSLVKLVEQLIQQDYDQIFVLDDASTDNSLQAIERFKSVKGVGGDINVGPAANRNRILDVLDYEAIIHFLDADVSLISKDNPRLAHAAFEDESVGLAGGLVTLPNGKQWLFNYGPRYSLYSSIGGYLQLIAAERKPLRKLVYYFVKDSPDLTKTPSTKQTFWVSEANMLIKRGVFKQIGGFDPELRYHEAQDISIKLHKHGYKVLHYPAISVCHPQIKMLDLKRNKKANKAGRQLVRKYGLPLK